MLWLAPASLLALACNREAGVAPRTATWQIATQAAGSAPRAAVAASVSPRAHRSVLITGVPHVQQRPDFCGEACVEMALRKLGFAVTQDEVFAASGVDPALGRGAVTRDLVRALARLGFAPANVYHAVRAAHARADLAEQFHALHADLAHGVPSIICTRYDGAPQTTEHFRLILGYDQQTDEVIYHEPAEARAAYRRMKRERLLSLWPLKYKPDRWTLIRIPLRPEKIVAPTRARARHSPADFAQHVLQLKRKLRRVRGSFTVVVQPPFVVVGDEWRGDVKRRAANRVQWAVDLLKQDYFARDPDQIIDIWLFKDRRSYNENTVRLFGEQPGTPFGFYSEAHRALVMNIATGEGTLVHELVHPFIAANFPACPPWFNEGLGSLYEGVGKREGHIYGYPNWRLPGLQQAIRARRVPSFATLLSRDTAQFYGADPGTNYAQSRYLLYHLQEKGLLRSFYRALLKNQRTDPTGVATLQRTLGVPDLVAWQRTWEAEMLKLSTVR